MEGKAHQHTQQISLFIQFLSWLTTLPCLRCLDDFHDCLDSLTLYMLDVAYSFHSLRFIEKYVIVFVCLFLFNVSGFVPCFAFWFFPGVQKAKCGGDFMCHYFLLFLNPFCHHFNYWLALIVKLIMQFYHLVLLD